MVKDNSSLRLKVQVGGGSQWGNSTVLYPGHEDVPELPLGAKDTEIFEEIGAGRRNLLFITRDKKIRTRPVERAKRREREFGLSSSPEGRT